MGAAVLHTQAGHREQLQELRAWGEAPEFVASPRNCGLVILVGVGVLVGIKCSV